MEEDLEREPETFSGEDENLLHEDNDERKESPLKKNILRALLILAALFLVAAAGLYFAAQSLLEPVDPGAGEADNVIVTVPQGSSTAQIAVILEEEQLVHNALFLRLYLRQTDPDAVLQAGDYKLNPAMTIDEIMEKMKKGDVYIETEWFVIPEGYDVRRMAQHLEEEGLIEDQSDFLDLAESPPQTLRDQFAFIEEIPAGVDFTLEGYLFPSKYEIESGSTAEDILAIMLRRFERFLTEENLERIEELGMTVHEVVTLASIVEREAASDKEWDLVASVFHNRLNIDMLLQSCATIQYALGEVKEALSYEDLRVESSYNTYQNPGLPPGPISSPGETALNAVLYPADTIYYYFVSKGDGSGEHYFATTLNEHNVNRTRAQRD